MQKNKIIFFLAVIIILGTVLRVTVISKSPYPINDGGLFYRMVIDLQQNNYQIPKYTTYNLQNIPFAYPPLPFYLVGFLNDFFNIDLFTLFRFVPLFFNILAIPLVFLFSRKLVKGDDTIALLSTAIWAILPPSFEWLIMGGGVTRSIAFTFSLLGCYYFVKYLDSRNPWHLVIGVIAGGITGLSHLEIFWVMWITVAVIWFFFEKSRKKFLPPVIFFAGCMVLLAPYIFSVIAQHGIDPFIAGFSAGEFSWTKPLKDIVLFFLTDELKTSIIAVVSLLGIFYQVIKKQYFFITWFFVLVILDPRSVNRSVLLPLSIIASIFLLELFNKIYIANDPDTIIKRRFVILTTKNVIGIILLSQVFILSYERTMIYTPTFDGISSSEVDSMDWINDNIPSNSNFVILTQASNWELDNFNEWFPALTEQKSITTVQGSEWSNDGGHDRVIWLYNGFKSCLYKDVSCLQDSLKNIDQRVDYVIVNHDSCDPGKIFCLEQYAELVGYSQGFKQVYNVQDVSIFRILNGFSSVFP